MNLLILTPDFPDEKGVYQVDIFVKEQIRFLSRHFNEIVVICPVPYGMDYLRKTKYIDYSFENVQVFFPRYFNIPLFYFLKMNLWTNFEVKSVLKLISQRKIKADIIHAHFTWPSGALAVRLKEHLKIPVVITEHTSISFNKAIKNKNTTYIETWKNADKIIRVRKGDVKLFENVGINLDKIVSIPNGFDGKIFHQKDMNECRKLLGLPQNKIIILNISNLYSEVKGHKYLIEAIGTIKKDRIDIICYIIGYGKLYRTLKKKIIALGLEDNIKLVGSKPHSELPLWINACDLFVLPSLLESFGIVQIEAMACGKPVIATMNGGSEEIIISNDYGLLAKIADSRDLADKIQLALYKKWDIGIIIQYAQHYKWEKIVEKIFIIYLKVITHLSVEDGN